MKKLLALSIVFMVITVVFGTVEVVTQQTLRQNANDPQIQLAQDAATQLNAGTSPTSIVQGKVDPSQSLAPFMIIYDASGRLVTSSGYIGGQVPAAPAGALTAAKGHDYRFVTWQPQTGVRIAAVTVAANHYFVLSGRSLKEVERNEDHVLQLSVMGWIASVVIVVLGMAAYRRLNQITEKRKQ